MYLSPTPQDWDCPPTITLRWIGAAEQQARQYAPAAPAVPTVPPEIRTDLAIGLTRRVQQWQHAGEPALDCSRETLEIDWAQSAGYILSDALLDGYGESGLHWQLSVEVERSVRILAVPPGILEPEQRRAALAGACERIGQVYRRLRRLRGEEAARAALKRLLGITERCQAGG